MRAAVLVLVACGSPAPVAPVPVVPPAPATATEAVVTGRVVLNGAPVQHFGIFVVSNVSSLPLSPHRLHAFHESAGRFTVRHEPSGRHLIVVGPGFARRTLVLQEPRTGTTDLGQIEVQPGFTIKGRVRDHAGSPVAGAVIAISQRGYSRSDPLVELAHGNFWTTSDKQGNYIIHGVAQIELHTGARARAWASGLGSFTQPLSMNDQTLDFTLEPAGTLEGTASRSGLLLLVSTRGPRRVIVETLERSFRVEGVPADTYKIDTQQVTIAANITTVQLP
jgi:hypothetical protein